jgi:hypothetical protein
MAMSIPARRRWHQFGLRTIFVVISVFAIVFSWVAYNAHWIQQRRQTIKGRAFTQGAGTTPGCLAWFGEKGRQKIYFMSHALPPNDTAGTREELLETARRLFPEARVLLVSTKDRRTRLGEMFESPP